MLATLQLTLRSLQAIVKETKSNDNSLKGLLVATLVQSITRYNLLDKDKIKRLISKEALYIKTF